MDCVSPLPDKSNWRLDEIAKSDANRALALEIAGTPTALVHEIVGRLDAASDETRVRFGHEKSSDKRGGYRAVIQYCVGANIFDWFFNARTGYRAHYRAHPACGLAFNNLIIETLLRSLDRHLRNAVAGRKIADYRDCGPTQIAKAFFSASLVPTWSKVWFCNERIGASLGELERLPSGVVGPRILVNGSSRWAAPYREDADAWLDVKGAFVGGECPPYQVKDPMVRAETLHAKGEA